MWETFLKQLENGQAGVGANLNITLMQHVLLTCLTISNLDKGLKVIFSSQPSGIARPNGTWAPQPFGIPYKRACQPSPIPRMAAIGQPQTPL